MTDGRPPLDAFDDEPIERAAADADLPASALRSIVERHQESVRDLPGVEDVVYEWRSQFHEDPLVHRTPAVYVLTLRPHVWEEFGDALDLSDGELAALRDVHDRQARRLVGEGATRFDSDAAVVLTRP